MSPAEGYGLLALVKRSNEGGPGPRYNMKEDPGSSTLIMKREHGHGVPCDPGQVIRILRCTSPPLPLPPPSEQPGQNPLPPPSGTYSSPAKVPVEASLGGNHTSASDSRSEAMDWARGGCGDHFELFSTSLGGQTAELVISAG